MNNSELIIFWMNLEIAFNPPILIADKNTAQKKTDCRGAMMEIGVTAKSEAVAKRLATDLISQLGGWESSRFLVRFTRIGLLSPEDLQHAVYSDPDVKDSLIQAPTINGIWYRTGFGFYNDDK